MATKQIEFEPDEITAETVGLLETDALISLHNTLHADAEGEDIDCLALRQSHDIVAVEILRRGMEHETPILCPDAELLTDAPNYRRSFVEAVCANCAFGQMPGWCNLYKFNYENDFVCDSFQNPQFLELERPHPFLIHKGQQTAIASDEQLPHGQPLIITSGDEAHGIVILEQAAQMQVKQFDREEWRDQHCVFDSERRLWWPDKTTLCVHQIKQWLPYDRPKLYIGGKIAHYEPTDTEERILSKSRKKLPKEIILIPEAVQVTGDRQFIQSGLSTEAVAQLDKVLKAAYEIEVKYSDGEPDTITPLYSLALVRRPALKFRKPAGEEGDKKKSAEADALKTSGNVGIGDDHEIDMSITQYLFTNSKAAAELGRAMTTAVEGAMTGDRTRADVVASAASAMGITTGTVNALLRGEHIPPDEGIEKFANAVGADFERLRAIAHKDSHLDDDEEDEDKDTKQEGFSDAPWDGAADRWDTADAFCRDSLIDINPAGEDKIKGLCKLPFRDPGTELPNKNAVRAIGGARGITAVTKPADVPQEQWDRQVSAAANKVIGWWPKAFEDRQASDAIFRLAGKEPPAEKAGRRLGRRWLNRLKDAMALLTDPIIALGELITWAEYDDGKDDNPAPALPSLPPGLFKGDSGFTVKKARDGRLWHVTWSTNAFEDRDREIFTTKALEEYTIEAERKSDRGTFDFWHIPNSDFAEKKWQGVMSRFLVETGPYFDNSRGRRVAKFFQDNPDGYPEFAPEGWGCSPEFEFRPEDRGTGIFNWLWIIRTSTLPRLKAANIWTEARQQENKKMALTPDQEKLAKIIFGEEDLKAMLGQAEKRTEALEQAGVAHKGQAPTEKETTPPVTEEPPAETAPAAPEEPEKSNITVDLDELAEAVSKQFNLDFEPLVAGITTLALEMKELGERVEKIELSEAVKAQVETPRFTLNLTRASQAEETVVEETDDLLKKGPKGQLPKQGDIASAIFPAK